jgi:ADP-heptose:LPS heptosyltransferase
MRLPSWLLDALSFPFLGPRPKPGEGQGVLIVSAGGLGDTALFLALLPRYLKLAKPGEKVALVLRKDAAKMAFLAPSGIEVLAVDFKRLAREISYRRSVFKDLRGRKLRLAVATDLKRHPHLDEALIKAAGAEQAFAPESSPWDKHQAALDANRTLYARIFDVGQAGKTDKLLRWADYADRLTGEAGGPPSILFPDGRLPAPEKTMFPTILVQPFSAVKAKQTPPDFYGALIASLPIDYRFVFLGAPSDLAANPDFRPILEQPRVAFDSRPFKDILPLIRGAKLVISVDTALMHLAASAGAPTLCLASAAYQGEMVPYDPSYAPSHVRFLLRDMPCKGCLGQCVHPLEQGMYPCIKALEPEDAARLALEILEGR